MSTSERRLLTVVAWLAGITLLVMLGVYPQPILDTSASSMNVIEQIFNPPAVALPAVTPTVTTGL